MPQTMSQAREAIAAKLLTVATQMLDAAQAELKSPEKGLVLDAPHVQTLVDTAIRAVHAANTVAPSLGTPPSS